VTVGIVAVVIAVANLAWVIAWSWWMRRTVYRRGYDKALADRTALVDLAANMASRYAISADEATAIVTAGLTPARPWWGTYEDPNS